MLKNEKLNKSFVVSRETAGAKESILSYEKLGKAFAGNKQEISLLKINLKTGRHHQIRVQFSNRGLPLMGDTKYSSFKENCNIALWAYHLSFKHPVKDEMVDIEYYPPREFPWNLFD